MTTTPLTRDMIRDASRWRLALSISAGSLEVLARCTASDDEAIAAVFPLSSSVSPATALEEAVYANPLLLEPFGHTDIVLVTPRYHLMPPEAAADTEVLASLCDIFDDDRPETFTAPIDSCNCEITLVDRDTARFIRRTFDRATVSGHIAVLGEWLGRRSRLGNSGKLFVMLRRDGRADILAYDKAGISAATTFMCPSSDDDVVYYILAVARAAGHDMTTDEIIIGGDSSRRAAITPVLARFSANVIPLIVGPHVPAAARGLSPELLALC